MARRYLFNICRSNSTSFPSENHPLINLDRGAERICDLCQGENEVHLALRLTT